MGNKKSKFAALFQEYPDVVSVSQLCKMLGVCKGNAYQLLHSGQIKYLRVGQVYRIPKLCVIDFLEKETKAAKKVTVASAEEILKGCREMRHPLKAQHQPKLFFYQILHGTPQGF